MLIASTWDLSVILSTIHDTALRRMVTVFGDGVKLFKKWQDAMLNIDFSFMSTLIVG